MVLSRLTSLVAPSKGSNYGNLILCEEDVRTLYASLDKSRRETVPLRSDSGLRTRDQILRFIDSAIDGGLQGINAHTSEDFTSISAIADSLGVKAKDIDKFLQPETAGDTWIRLDDRILTRHGYQRAADSFVNDLQDAPLYLSKFCAKYHLTADALAKMISQYNRALLGKTESDVSEHILEYLEGNEYVYTRKLGTVIQESLRQQMVSAKESVMIVPNLNEKDAYSAALTLKLAREILDQKPSEPRGLLEASNESVKFIPYSVLTKQRDCLLEDLKDGKRKFITESDITPLDIEREGFDAFVSRFVGSEDLLLKKSIVSRKHLENLVVEARVTLENKNAASIPISSELDGRDLLALSNAVIKEIKRSHKSNHDFVYAGRYNEHIIYFSFQESIRAEILQLAEAQATTSEPRSPSTSSPKLVWPSIIDAVHKNHEGISDNLISSLLTSDVQSSASKAFASALSSVQQRSQNDFARFWTSKCLTKTHLHLQGVAEIQDGRLKSELHKLTLVYLVEKSIPDVLRRADEKGYLHGRAPARVVDVFERRLSTLEVSLKTSNPESAAGANADLQAISEGLEDALLAFSRAMGVTSPDEAALQTSKKAYLREMAHSADQETDSARLFLKLILALSAQYRRGTIYATGRFAPRLAKELSEKLDGQRYTWLRNMRDKARTGSMSTEDMEEVRQAIRAACSEDKMIRT